MKRHRLLIHHPQPADATSFWRAAGPFSELRPEHWDVTIAADIPDWTSIAAHDVILLQRPFRGDHLTICQCAKSLGRKLWIDYDDALFDVPASNPSFRTYHSMKIRQNIATMLTMADAVTFSTDDLNDRMRAIVPKMLKSRTIPNAWNDSFSRGKPVRPFKAHKRILWRGTATHNEDIEGFLPEIVALARRYDDWEWLFIGEPSWKALHALPHGRAAVLDSMNIIKYFNFLGVLEASVAIVPLVDSPFNRCKSNIAWQEATYGGCAVVAPDWREWQFDGVASYGSEHTFTYAFDRAVRYGQSLHARSWASIMTHRKLSDINGDRLSLLDELMES